MPLIPFLQGKQRELGLSDSRFASYLGIDRATYNQLKHHKLRPGRKLFVAALQRFPKDAPSAILDEFQADVAAGRDEASCRKGVTP